MNVSSKLHDSAEAFRVGAVMELLRGVGEDRKLVPVGDARHLADFFESLAAAEKSAFFSTPPKPL
jgi:hypothetical protein